jgi:hypothetical protein
MLAVTAVEALAEYALRLTFDDGSERVVDLADELWGPRASRFAIQPTFGRSALTPNSGPSSGPTASTSTPTCSAVGARRTSLPRRPSSRPLSGTSDRSRAGAGAGAAAALAAIRKRPSNRQPALVREVSREPRFSCDHNASSRRHRTRRAKKAGIRRSAGRRPSCGCDVHGFGEEERPRRTACSLAFVAARVPPRCRHQRMRPSGRAAVCCWVCLIAKATRSSSLGSGAHTRRHRAYAADAASPAKWRSRWVIPSEHLADTTWDAYVRATAGAECRKRIP